jgi:hypothetical protein
VNFFTDLSRLPGFGRSVPLIWWRFPCFDELTV